MRISERVLQWRMDGRRYASNRDSDPLPFRIKKHQSVLIRKLGDADIQLQRNKVDNLRIVVDRLSGLLIRPEETFSFCRLVGPPLRIRGFKPGMELSNGEPRTGVGGGICQASNLIFWLALHTPLEVVERHHHSFDPFPDQGRVLPYASGATVMFNYLDLRLHNPTNRTFQLRMWFDAKCLNAEFRLDDEWPLSYKVFERAHRFERVDAKWWRRNELWRRVIDKSNGTAVREEFLFANRGAVMYEPTPDDRERTSSLGKL